MVEVRQREVVRERESSTPATQVANFQTIRQNKIPAKKRNARVKGDTESEAVYGGRGNGVVGKEEYENLTSMRNTHCGWSM